MDVGFPETRETESISRDLSKYMLMQMLYFFFIKFPNFIVPWDWKNFAFMISINKDILHHKTLAGRLDSEYRSLVITMLSLPGYQLYRLMTVVSKVTGLINR